MDALSFKDHVKNALNTTITTLENKILNDTQSPIDQAKFSAGVLNSLINIRDQLEDIFQDCLNTSRKAVDAAVLADYLKKKIDLEGRQYRNAILNGSYESVNQRSNLQGFFRGFSDVVASMDGLLASFIQPKNSQAPEPEDGICDACVAENCEVSVDDAA